MVVRGSRTKLCGQKSTLTSNVQFQFCAALGVQFKVHGHSAVHDIISDNQQLTDYGLLIPFTVGQ
jgi:hypothetical protein